MVWYSHVILDVVSPGVTDPQQDPDLMLKFANRLGLNFRLSLVRICLKATNRPLQKVPHHLIQGL